jgi:DNA-binding MarR family transcriptional regulator
LSPQSAALTHFVHAARLTASQLDSAVEPFRITYSSYSVLARLSFSPENRLPMSKLSSLTVLHPASITKIIDRLVKRGCVRRVIDPTDRRVVYAELLPAGSELVTSATEAVSAIGFGMQNLEEEDLEMFVQLLDKLCPPEQMGILP